jgi:RimJ/RimL family protein N-acetyltransferase
VARLPDGTTLHLRPLRAGERQPLLDVFDQMSSRSRYLRFLSPVRRLSEPALRQLTALDEGRHVAWAAWHELQCVAIARYVRSDDRPDTAELAVSVIDAMHRRGVARLLLGTLAAVAARQGITTFTLTVHSENRSSLALCRSLGARFRFADGQYEGTLPLAAVLADERVQRQLPPDGPQAAVTIPAPRTPERQPAPRPGPQPEVVPEPQPEPQQEALPSIRWAN